LFRKKATSFQLSVVSLRLSALLLTPDTGMLDFFALSFVFINIPGLFRYFLAMRLAVMDFVALASLGDIWQRHIAWHWFFP